MAGPPAQLNTLADLAVWREPISQALAQLPAGHPLLSASEDVFGPMDEDTQRAWDDERHAMVVQGRRAQIHNRLPPAVPLAYKWPRNAGNAVRNLPEIRAPRGWQSVGPPGVYMVAAALEEATRRQGWAQLSAADRSAPATARRRASQDAEWLSGYISTGMDGVQASSAAWMPALNFTHTAAPAAPSRIGAW